MSDTEVLPEEISKYKDGYEARKLKETYIACKEKLANKSLDKSERKALEFYVEQLKKVHPCADENKFQKFGRGIGGSGDTEVVKPYVVRDRKSKKPLLNEAGELIIINCVFEDLARYLDTIKSGRAESLRRSDGVRPLRAADEKYAEPDPYAYAFHNANSYDD